MAWSNGGQGVVCERRERAHPAPNDRRVVSWTRRTGCTPVERHICESAQRDARKGARERGTKLSERTGRELSHARQMPQTSSSVVHVQLATACQFLMVTFMPQFVPQLAGGIRRRIVRARDSLAARRDCSGSVSAASTKCFAVNARFTVCTDKQQHADRGNQRSEFSLAIPTIGFCTNTLPPRIPFL